MYYIGEKKEVEIFKYTSAFWDQCFIVTKFVCAAYVYKLHTPDKPFASPKTTIPACYKLAEVSCGLAIYY